MEPKYWNLVIGPKYWGLKCCGAENVGARAVYNRSYKVAQASLKRIWNFVIFISSKWSLLLAHCVKILPHCEHVHKYVVAKVENRKSLWIRLLLTSKEFEVWKSSKMLASRLHTYGGPHSIWTASYSWQYTTQCSKNWKSARMYVCTSTFLEVVVTM